MRPFPKLIIAIAAFLATESMATSTDITGKVTEIELHSTDPADQSSCEVGKAFVYINNTYYWFPATGEEGKSMLSLFETAKATGLSVFIRVTDLATICSSYKKVQIAKLKD